MHNFLAQKRIAVAGVSRNHSHHPVGNLIYQRLKKTGHDVFPVNPHMQTFQGERCYPDLTSIPGGVDGVVIITRPETTEQIVRECISVIAGACPMMFGPGADFGPTCMRLILRLTGGLPT
jgi:predicted CoA-binding protein